MPSVPEPRFDELYRELILDHYRNPRNRAPLEHPDVVAEGYNPLCGDEVTLQLKFDDDRVAEVSFHGHGCSISQSSGSMMSEAIKGRSVEDIRRLSQKFKAMVTNPDAEPDPELGDLEALHGVARFAVRVKCATLPWHTLEDGLARRRNGVTHVTHEET
ncbi:MAG TPA: SUF system NifU family Fe-S cluster assembly protein [Dehalococcoidia bacterium]|nr:SUF system NifU family Fe-S cluster assembly protein [Dehalococcoidia bacterium]